MSERRLLGRGRLRRAGALALAVVLTLVHVVFAAPLLLLRSRSMVTVGVLLDRADDTIPKDPDVRQKTVILANTPADPFAGYIQIMRASLGEPRPRRIRWLASGESAVELERLDRFTLRVAPEGGFLASELELMLRSPRRPFSRGDRVELTGVTIEVESLTADGRPASVVARFDRPLEDPSLLWLRWGDGGYQPYEPPAVGGRDRLPPVDFKKLFDASSGER